VVAVAGAVAVAVAVVVVVVVAVVAAACRHTDNHGERVSLPPLPRMSCCVEDVRASWAPR